MRSRWTSFKLGVLALVLGYAAFQKGGVWERDWNLCLIAIGLLALCFRLEPGLNRASRYLLLACVSLALVQLVPLPVGVLRLISPARYELVRGLEPVAGPIQFAPLTVVPATTLVQVVNLAAYFLVFVLACDIARRTQRAPWLCALPFLAIGLLEAGLGIWQYHAGEAGAVRGTWVSRDHYAGFLEMCVPFAALYAIAILRRNPARSTLPVSAAVKACALLSAAALLFLAILFSLSRMAFVASLISLFVAGCLCAIAGRSGRSRWLGIAAAAVLTLGAFIFLPSDALIARLATLATTHGVTADVRAQIWRETLGLIRAFPAFGCGLGGYESGFLPYKEVAPMNTVDFAHNDYLQYWAEFGTIGFLIGLFFCARLFVKTLGVATSNPDADRRYRALAAVASLTAMGLHSFVDFNLSIPANAMLLAWISGIGAASHEPEF